MYDRFLHILLESSAKRKAEIAAILARRSGVKPVDRKPGQFGAGAGVGRADQLAAIAQRNKPSQGGFSGSKTAELQRQQDFQRDQVSQSKAAEREKQAQSDKAQSDKEKEREEKQKSKDFNKYKSKLRSMLRKVKSLTKVPTPKPVY